MEMSFTRTNRISWSVLDIYAKFVARSTALLFNKLRSSWLLSFSIYGSSFDFRSAMYGIKRKYVGIPHRLTIASTSSKRFSVYWCVFDWAHKWNCIITWSKSFNCSFEIFFNCSCYNCTWLNFVHSKVYWWM